MRAQQLQEALEVLHVVGDLRDGGLQGQIGEDLVEELQGFIHGLQALDRQVSGDEVQAVDLQAQWRELRGGGGGGDREVTDELKQSLCKHTHTPPNRVGKGQPLLRAGAQTEALPESGCLASA